ncbi:hypothetical protein C2845_PM17G10500 [Panicum miliaceum]|uniref:Neprosin PEP catalytic domain-containing protein n=1 Tax=Panicum miliaceum TaxID=4540 RepID=A0A3L6Q117_PANMI|nr:hypothetical protein C2845_PM17G10500 [Panicum miliaceum]
MAHAFLFLSERAAAAALGSAGRPVQLRRQTMRPSYHPGDLHDDDDSNIARRPITQTWHQNGSKCPENTIPIRRTKEEDILRASAVGRYGKKMPRSIQNLVSVNDLAPNLTIGHQHAVASAQEDKYYGTNATINLWQPMIGRANDFSLAQLRIIGGPYNDLNTIEAGWQNSIEDNFKSAVF